MFRKSFLAAAVVVCGAVVFVTSCNKNNVEGVELQNATTEVVETVIQLPSKDGSDKVEDLKVTFTVYIDEETDEIISKEVSDNLLAYFNLEDQKEFESFIYEKQLEIQNSPVVAAMVEGDDDTGTSDKHNHADCIEGCMDKYTDENGDKIRGRGRCKANCWVQTSIEIIKIIVPFLAKL